MQFLERKKWVHKYMFGCPRLLSYVKIFNMSVLISTYILEVHVRGCHHNIYINPHSASAKIFPTYPSYLFIFVGGEHVTGTIHFSLVGIDTIYFCVSSYISSKDDCKAPHLVDVCQRPLQ